MLTYAGIFDDQVFRYPGSAARVVRRDNALNEVLLRCLYLGRPLAINDGYILQNEFLVRSIIDKDSFFRTLARHGYIVLLRRTSGRLSELVNWAKEHGVLTLSMPDRDVRWEALAVKFNEFEDDVKLADFVTYGSVPKFIKRWPKRDTGDAFIRTMKYLLENDLFPVGLMNKFEYEDIKKAFLKYAEIPREAPDRLAPRTFWEQHLRKVYRENKKSPLITHQIGKRFMELANCVYHFNYAAVFEAQGEPMNVNTPMDSVALNFALGDVLEGDLPKPIPKVKIPNNLFKVDSSIAIDFVQNAELLKAKDKYLKCVEHYVTTLEDYESIKETAQRYTALLDRFRKPESCKVLNVKTFVRIAIGTTSSVAAWLRLPPHFAIPATITAIVSSFGEPVLHRLIRNVTARKIAPFYLTTRRIPRVRQIQIQPTGAFYGKLVKEFKHDLDELYVE